MSSVTWKEMTDDQKKRHTESVYRYYKKNQEKFREKTRAWRKSDKHKEYQSRPRTAELDLSRKRKYRESHKELLSKKNSERQSRIKADVFSNYGGKCLWCGESNSDLLTIDHILQHNHDGFGGTQLYKKIIDLGYPKDLYRLLCYNCNKKAWLLYRDSINSRSKNAVKSRKTLARLKLNILDHYGGRVCPCGVDDVDKLTIDHINGGGRKHSKELAEAGTTLYNYLKKSVYPEGYRVLCYNCNIKKYKDSKKNGLTSNHGVSSG